VRIRPPPSTCYQIGPTGLQFVRQDCGASSKRYERRRFQLQRSLVTSAPETTLTINLPFGTPGGSKGL
jgi:hypothetical protein